jgi:hypothetical protein
MGVCFELAYNRTNPQTKLHICHLHSLGGAYLKPFFLKFFWVDPYV